jgi:MFS family permease
VTSPPLPARSDPRGYSRARAGSTRRRDASRGRRPGRELRPAPATTATAFAFAPWYFFLCRFLTGSGIGGEYAAINSAIDELISEIFPTEARALAIAFFYAVGTGLGGIIGRRSPWGSTSAPL